MAQKITILCPYCFKSFRREEVQVQCKNYQTVMKVNENGSSVTQDVCPPEEDEAFNSYWGTRTRVKHIFDANLTSRELGGLFRKPQLIQEKECPLCGVSSSNFVCPHGHNRLPVEMIEKGCEIISVVGGPASGKSNYIVALIHELKKYGSRLGLSVTLQQVGRTDKEKTSNKYREFSKIVFEDHMALPKTPEVKHPIPWIMRLESNTTQKAVYLVFYDTAGEAFNDPDKIARDAQYLEHSKAVIVAFDTLGIPKIKRILEKKGIDVGYQISRYEYMWETIKNINHDNAALNMTSRPYAFVFTKFDAVIDNYEDLSFQLNDFVDDNGKFVNSSFVKDGVVDLSELKHCSMAIKDALRGPWNEEVEEDLANGTETMWKDNGMFFGVSALGGMKDSLSIRTEGGEDHQVVKPVKVLDPLIWILVKLGGFGINAH